MKVLVVHGSRSGWTTRAAEIAADALRADGHDVTLAAAATAPGPEGHDAVAVLGGVRAMQWNPEAAVWVQAHAEALRPLRLGVATVSLSPQNAGGILDKLLVAERLVPVVRAELAGGYDPDGVSLAERMVMMAMNQKPCDNLDAVAVASFARAVVTPT